MPAKKSLITSGLFLVVSLILAAPLQAQSFLSLTAIPPRLEVEVKPGQVVTKTIKVRNDSPVERFVSVEVKDYVVSNQSGTPIQLDTSQDTSANRWAAASWVQVSPSRFQIGPSQTKAIVVTILAPEDALPGGHYAMILHSPDSGSALDQSGSAIRTNVGSLLYIKVPGTIKQQAKVKIFSAPEFQEYGPVNFKTVITNLSDIHITPIGSIKVTNWFGQSIGELTLKDANIFPYASRDFQNVLPNKWLFGRYKANLLASYGTAGDFVSDNLYFWVIPWRVLTLVIVAILIIILLISLLSPNQKPTTVNKQIEEVENELKSLKNKYKDRR